MDWEDVGSKSHHFATFYWSEQVTSLTQIPVNWSCFKITLLKTWIQGGMEHWGQLYSQCSTETKTTNKQIP